MPGYSYSTEVGQHVVIAITGMIPCYIAEVISQDPLELKVQEDGPFARLKFEDFIVCEDFSDALQRDPDAFLRDWAANGRRIISGLKSCNVTDGQLHEILPMPD